MGLSRKAQAEVAFDAIYPPGFFAHREAFSATGAYGSPAGVVVWWDVPDTEQVAGRVGAPGGGDDYPAVSTAKVINQIIGPNIGNDQHFVDGAYARGHPLCPAEMGPGNGHHRDQYEYEP